VVIPLTLDERMLFMVELFNSYRENAYKFTREGKPAASLKFAASLYVRAYAFVIITEWPLCLVCAAISSLMF
jgi:hypothetical protein